MRWLRWLLLGLAIMQFVAVGLPPGNADLLSIQLLAYDLSHGDFHLLYPGRDYALNDAWVAHHEQNLRELRVIGEPNWCFYPPLIPYLFVPVATVGVEIWRIGWGAVQLLLAMGFVLLIERMLAAANLPSSRILLAALVFGAYPVARSVNLGQTSLLIALLLWSAVYLREDRRRVWAALASGIAIFVKPFLLLTELPALQHRRFGAPAVAISTVALLLLVSIGVAGIHANREYWNLLSTLGVSQTAFSGNQSLLAGVMRLTTTASVSDYGFQMDPALDTFGKLLAVIVLSTAAWAQWRSANPRPVYTVGMWCSAALLALPISWEHHLILLLPALAFLWAERGVPRWGLICATAALLVALEFAYSDGGGGRLAANLPLFGNLTLFVLLVYLHARRPATRAVIS